MTTPDVARRMTTDEFLPLLRLADTEDRLVELIHGRVVEKVEMTFARGVIALNIGASLHDLVIIDEMNGFAALGAHYYLLDDPYNVRCPDVSVSLNQMPTHDYTPVARMPDLTADIQLYGQPQVEIFEKASYAIVHGTRLAWLVFQFRRRVGVMTADGYDEYGEGDTLHGGTVLPGFELPVSLIFEDVD